MEYFDLSLKLPIVNAVKRLIQL